MTSAVATLPTTRSMAAVVTEEVTTEPTANAASTMLSANTSPTTRGTEKPFSVARW